MMGKNFRETLNEQLKDPAFKREYDELEPEFAIINAIIDARKEMGLTQKQLSELTGITQADISKLENGNANPSLKTLQRLAAAMGKSVKISLFIFHGISISYAAALSTISSLSSVYCSVVMRSNIRNTSNFACHCSLSSLPAFFWRLMVFFVMV